MTERTVVSAALVIILSILTPVFSSFYLDMKETPGQVLLYLCIVIALVALSVLVYGAMKSPGVSVRLALSKTVIALSASALISIAVLAAFYAVPL